MSSNPFKQGDKVKAIDNVINRCNIAGDLSNGRIMEVMGIVDDHLLIDDVYMHYSRFELAEPVEGSREWALEQMKKGLMVCNTPATYYYRKLNECYIERIDIKTGKQDFPEPISTWNEVMVQNLFWQLYHPAKFANVNPDEWTICPMPDGDKIYMLTESQAEEVRALLKAQEEK